MGIQVVNERFDPFAEAYSPVTIVSEAHVVPNYAPFVVYLNEIPQADTPSSVSIPDFVEVAAPPVASEFRVDYRHKTGTVEFNAESAGKTVYVSYIGLGTPGLCDFLNQIASNDPQYLYHNWWSHHDIGDHFTNANSYFDRIRWNA